MDSDSSEWMMRRLGVLAGDNVEVVLGTRLNSGPTGTRSSTSCSEATESVDAGRESSFKRSSSPTTCDWTATSNAEV